VLAVSGELAEQAIAIHALAKHFVGGAVAVVAVFLDAVAVNRYSVH
jgi:hypothetical protein